MIQPPNPPPSSDRESGSDLDSGSDQTSESETDLHPPQILEAIRRLVDLTQVCDLTSRQSQESRADLAEILTYMGLLKIELTRARSAIAAESAAAVEMRTRWRTAQRDLGETRMIAHESDRIIAQKDAQIDQLRWALADQMSRASDAEIAHVRHGLDEILPAHQAGADRSGAVSDRSASDTDGKRAPQHGCDMPTPAGRCGRSIADLLDRSPSFQYCDHHLRILREGATPEESQRGDGQPPEPPAKEDRLQDIFSGVVELTARERAYLRNILQELDLSGWMPVGVRNRRRFIRQFTDRLLGPLKLTKMVTPDGSRLVSKAEYDDLVSKPEHDDQVWKAEHEDLLPDEILRDPAF